MSAEHRSRIVVVEGHSMRTAVAWLLMIGFFQVAYGQEGAGTQALNPPFSCSFGSIPAFEKASSPQFQAKVDALRHKTVYFCAETSAEWAEKIVISQAKTPESCQEARLRYPRPVFPALQPMEIKEAGYSNVDSFGAVLELVFRLPSGRQVKIGFSAPDDRVRQSDDLMVTLGLLQDPLNSPYTSAEVESILNKDFPVGTRREVLACAYGVRRENLWLDEQKRQWWVFEGRGYRFNEGRVAEIRDVSDKK
jgi:hypothetical protein